MVLHNKFTLHQPLNRQSEAYAREGIDLLLSTLADDVGSCAAVLSPLGSWTRRPGNRRLHARRHRVSSANDRRLTARTGQRAHRDIRIRGLRRMDTIYRRMYAAKSGSMTGA